MRISVRLLAVLILGGCSAASRMPPGSAGVMRVLEADKAEKNGDFARCLEIGREGVRMHEDDAAKPLTAPERANVLAYSAGAEVMLASCLVKMQRKEESNLHLERCLIFTEQALAAFDGLPPPADELAHIIQSSGQAYGRLNRAFCFKALGRLREAVAAREESLAYHSKLCGLDWPAETKERFCGTVADEMENVAKWKKELAAQGKMP